MMLLCSFLFDLKGQPKVEIEFYKKKLGKNFNLQSIIGFNNIANNCGRPIERSTLFSDYSWMYYLGR